MIGRFGRGEGLLGTGSWIGGGNAGSGNRGLVPRRLIGFWLQISGWFSGLKVKNPAENTRVLSPCCLLVLMRLREEEVAEAATEQYGFELASNFTEHLLILFTCLLTENGSFALNSPCSSVFTSCLKLGFEFSSMHSTATNAPGIKWLGDLEKAPLKQVSQ